MEKHWTEETFEEVKAICENATFEANLDGGYNHATIIVPTSIGNIVAYTNNSSNYYGGWCDWEIKTPNAEQMSKLAIVDTIATVTKEGLVDFFTMIQKMENK